MPLPLYPGPRTADVAVTGWSAITVRVAWALLSQGVRVRPSSLRDARDHVLYHLEPGTPLAHAEDRADTLTRQFVAHARRQRWEDPWQQDASMPLSPRWRRSLDNALTPLTMAVFRRHYGDARPLVDLERRLQVDRIALEGARGGLREVVRQAGCADGLPLHDWPNDRLDALLCRLAAFAPEQCPPRDEVTTGRHRPHLTSCARCTRTVRLLRTGVLRAADLEPPLGAARPRHRVSVLALHFHPDGRHHRSQLSRELDASCAPVGDDLLLIDWSEPDNAPGVLLLATQVGAPARDHLRGVVLEGPGRWSRHGLIGPLVDDAQRAVRSRRWGTVDKLGELPDALPDPPSARRLWIAAGVAGLLALFTTQATLAARAPHAEHPLEARFSSGRGGIWSSWDVDERAHITLVRDQDGALEVVLASDHPADKAAFAVGDGSYRLHTVGNGVLLVSSRQPLDDLGPMVASANVSTDPLDSLAERVRVADPSADVLVRKR